MKNGVGIWSSFLNGMIVILPILSLFSISVPAQAASTAPAPAPAPAPVGEASTAAYLADPASWPEGSVILGAASARVLQNTPALEVKTYATNRCFAIGYGDADKPIADTLPPTFHRALGDTAGSIYMANVSTDTTVFLAAVRSPVITDPTVANYDCYKLSFSYKEKPAAAK